MKSFFTFTFSGKAEQSRDGKERKKRQTEKALQQGQRCKKWEQKTYTSGQKRENKTRRAQKKWKRNMNRKKPGGRRRGGRSRVLYQIWSECNATEERLKRCESPMKCTYISNNRSSCDGLKQEGFEITGDFEECCFECKLPQVPDPDPDKQLCRRRRNETGPTTRTTGTSPGFELYRKTVCDAFSKLASGVAGYITNFADEFLFGRQSPL